MNNGKGRRAIWDLTTFKCRGCSKKRKTLPLTHWLSAEVGYIVDSDTDDRQHAIAAAALRT